MRFNRLEKSAKVKTTRRKCEAGIKAGFLYVSPNFSTQMVVS